MAVAVATIVLGASVASVSAGGPANGGPIGGPTGDGSAARVPAAAVGGLARSGAIDGDDYQSDLTDDGDAGRRRGRPDRRRLAATWPPTRTPSPSQGPFLEDGTLLKPVAVDTAIEDGSDLLRTYKVQVGRHARRDRRQVRRLDDDRLVGERPQEQERPAHRPGPDDPAGHRPGRHGHPERHPRRVRREVQRRQAGHPHHQRARGSEPGRRPGHRDPGRGRRKGIKTPKPPVKTTITHPATKHHSSGGGGGGTVRPPTTYNGGHFVWPVVGGGNYISQYFHYGHCALDIAADYGSTVRAGGGGTVIFAGWKNNGGGYQVWIAHGSNLYTTYNHMSAITVGRGQHVGRGQQVGRIGQSGNATGPHLHFEVWVGPVWDGGTRVNPLGYL